MHWEQHLDKVGVIKDIWCNRIFIFINTHRQSLPIYQHQNMRKFCLFIWGHCLCVLTCTCASLLRWFSMSPNLLLHLFVYIWLESALHSIFQLWMSRNQGQRLCSHSLNFDLLSKSFGIYFNHITVSTQNFGKSSTHQKSPFLEVSIFGYGLSVRSHPHIHKNSNISKSDEGMFLKF